MKHKRCLRAGCVGLALTWLVAVPGMVQAQAPDLTVTNLAAIDTTYTYNLGPTGMRGWIYHNWPVTPRLDANTEFAPWQILVTTVGTNTPAYGIMASNDVMLGVSTGAGASVSNFPADARVSLGWAITAAEAGDGKLNIKRWRAGVSTNVTLQLQIMGAYSDTAPYNCPKTALILTNAANSLQQCIVQNGWNYAGGPGSINALALLATGNTNYLPMLQAYARSIAPTTMNLEQSGGISAWDCYNSIFLAEYYMLTGDSQVFHGLSEYVIYAATHQSMYGTAGHGFSNIPPPGGWLAGGTHGSMSWYGPVNQAGLVAQLSIVLGKKAGVVSPEIDPAIARAANFFGYYVNRGSIPYGEHEPYPGDLPFNGRVYYNHQSNGKDGLAAVLFGSMGDRPLQTEYYSRMAVAGFTGEQYGHTGQGFSYLWTTLGAHVGGTNAVAEYLKKVRWHRDLTRRCDGSFVYDGGEQFGCSSANDYWAYTTYHDNPTAYYVLHAAIPLHKLYITGKNANPTNQLSAQVVSNALWASEFTANCGGYTTNQLVSALGEWDPIVRFNAATELSVRSSGPALIPMLIVMAENPTNANQREAACTALGCLKATNAVPALVRRLSDTDIWVRAKAAKALGALGTSAVTSLPAMLGAFVTNVAPTYPFEAGFNWDDPLQIGNGYLAETLFDKLGNYTISADKSLLYPAVQAGVKQPAGMWRGKLDDFVQNRLTLADVEVLILDLLEDARTEGPCDRMFTVTPPAAAMNALAKYNIQEGLQVCFENVAYWGDVLGATAINRLAGYGEAARWTLPDLYADYYSWTHDNNYPYLATTIATLEAATSSPALIYGLPTAFPQILATSANTAKPITLTGTSCRTNTLTHTIATQPAHGTLTGTAPNLTYTPATDYQGMDSFTFTVTDSLTNSLPATVHIVVGASGNGLKGLYYDNMDFTSLKAAVTNQTINFDWGTAAPTNTMGADTYSVRWTGQVMAPETGTYRFSTRTSDGVRLWVNGAQVIDDWNDQAANIWNDSAPIALTAGQKYSLRMEYYRNANPATVRLYWYMPSRQACSIIPQELLFSAGGVSLTSPLNGARFGLPAGLPATIMLTAEVTDAGTVTNVSFYNGNALIGSVAAPPYVAAWTGVTAGQYSLTARATDNTGLVSTSAVAVITVDLDTVPVTTGLACYYDASVGVSTDINGTVTSWTDRSGNAHHATLLSGAPALATNQINAKPVVQFRGNNCILDCAGAMFTKEQYVVVRSPNATWSGSGSFLGRKSADFLTVRASSYNLYSGYTGFWDDQLPAAVSKNGTAVSSGSGSMPRGGFELGTITNYVLLKITVNDAATPANLAAYPYYQIGRNETLNSCEMDLAEIIGYDHALPPNDEALVGSYLAAKYGISTPYRAAGSLINLPATGITSNTAVLNATLGCNGTNLAVVAYWGTVNGGTNAASWNRSAYVGAWTNVASTNLSCLATGLVPSTTYYFTFRATNTVTSLWADNVLNFTTLGPPLVDNSAGATNLTVGVAQLRGSLFNGPADVRLFWGTTDGGTNGPWTNTNLVAGAASGAVSVTISNLLYGLTYYYRCSASNQYGLTWATNTASFTTLRPQSSSLSVINSLALWLDASQLTGLANGQQVNTWTDMSGQTNHALRQSGSSAGYPQYVTGQLNGKPVVRFNSGNGNTGDYFKFNRITTIRSAFWVLKENAGTSDGHFLLGDDSSYDFHRASANGPLWEVANGWSSLNIRNGTTKLMGTATNGTTAALPANQFQVVSLVTVGNVQANQVTQDRVYHGSWQGDIAEILIYTNALSASDETSVGSYLTTKYGLNTAYPPSTDMAANALTNKAATGIASNAAVLNAMLASTGAVYNVYAYWNTVNGGTNAALWTNVAYVGAFTNVASTNLSCTATGLTPNTTYYFTFRGTNAVCDLWATNVLAFTTLPPPGGPTTTALSSSLGSGGVYGQTVVFTATVSVPSNGPPTGIVTFKDGAAVLGTGTLSAGQATCTNSTLTATNHSLTAAYGGDSHFLSSTSSPLAYAVSPKPVTITGMTAAGKTYDGTASAVLSGGAVAGVINGDTVTVVLGTGTFASANAGTWPVTATGYALGGANAGNYSLSAQPNPGSATIAPLAVTITGVTASNKVYDGTTSAVLNGGAVSGVLSNDTVTMTAGTGAFTNANAGTWPVTATGYALGGGSAGNYTLSVQPNPGSATIMPRAVQLTGARVYDATTAAAATNLSIVNNVDGANLTLTGSATLAGKDVGAQAIVTNYATPARVQSVTSYVNNVTTYSVTVAAPANSNTLIAVVATRGTSASRVTGISQSGATWTRAAQAANTNGVTTEIWYAPNVSGAGTTVTITNASSLRSAAVVMEYSGLLAAGALDQTNGATSSGTAAVTGTTPATTQPNELWLGSIAYSNSTPTLGSILNSFAAVTNARSSSSTASQNVRVYALERLATATNTASAGGTISSTSQWAGAIATFKAASTSSLALGGPAAANYTLAGAGGSVAVTPKALWVTGLTASNRVYDGTKVVTLGGTAALQAAEAPGSGSSSDGKPYTGDTLTVDGTGVGAFADKHAGTNKTVTVTGNTLGGAQAGNYSLIQQTGLTANVTPLPITVAAVPAAKTYDGTLSGTGTPTITPALAAGDTTTVLSQAFQDPNAGAGNKVLAPSIAINDGRGGANYAVTLQNCTTGTINPAPATVELGNLTATYDGTPKSATAATVPTNLTVSLTYNGSATAPTAAGSYAVLATVVESNYQGSASGTLTINPAGQTIAFGPLPAHQVGDAPFGLTATASSGLPVSYASSDESVATVSGSNVTILAAGTTTLTASQAGNGNYAAAVPVNQTLTVQQVVPATPTGLAAAATNAQVNLTWNAVTNAAGYRVKRALDSNDVYQAIGQPVSAGYTDAPLTNGVLYWYVVAASNSAGASADSTAVSARPLPPVAPTPVLEAGSGFSVDAGMGAVFQLDAMGGIRYRLRYTDDLQPPPAGWLWVTPPADGWITAPTNGPLLLMDPAATNSLQRFYRFEAQKP